MSRRTRVIAPGTTPAVRPVLLPAEHTLHVDAATDSWSTTIPVTLEPGALQRLHERVMSVAVCEILGFDPRLLADLAPTTLLCARAHGGGRLMVTTQRAAYAAAQAVQMPAFVGGELVAMTLAAEHERGSPVALEEWCRRKLAESSWRLTEEQALGPVFGDFAPRGWTFERVFRVYELQLLEVGVLDEVLP